MKKLRKWLRSGTAIPDNFVAPWVPSRKETIVAAVLAAVFAVAADRLLHPVGQTDDSVCELTSHRGWYNNHPLDDGLLRCNKDNRAVQKKLVA